MSCLPNIFVNSFIGRNFGVTAKYKKETLETYNSGREAHKIIQNRLGNGIWPGAPVAGPGGNGPGAPELGSGYPRPMGRCGIFPGPGGIPAPGGGGCILPIGMDPGPG